ncbi:MAG TPA: T9SS type A sorting domain-containing protein [Bacteroidia bacterium]|nr:T9SS type A sorting domain-containing protein [Bacteroidia bacterium]
MYLLKSRFIFIFLFSFPFVLCAQKAVHVESPYGNSNDGSLPTWAKEMYKSNPNLYLVKKLYENHYQTHPFEKNEHTQYYKRWVHYVQNLVDDNGNVVYPNRQQHDQINNAYQQQINSRQSSFGPGSEWSCIGPFDFDKDANGRSHAPGAAHVYTIEKSASNPNFLVAGTANAGVYKTIDKGLNWVPLTENLLIGECNAVEIQFNNTDVIYAGGNGRIYKTIDGGVNWFETGDAAFNSNFHKVYSIVMVPGHEQKLFASTNFGLYGTLDGGTTWNQLVSSPGTNEYFGDIELHPTDTNIVYAIYNSKLVGGNNKLTQFYKSIDGGNSFNPINLWPSSASTITGANHQRRAEIAVTPAAPNRVYAILTGKFGGGEGLFGFYRSEDAGETWTHYCCGSGPGGLAAVDNVNVMGYADDGTDDGGQYYYDLAIAADQINPDKVHVAGIMQWISTDAGSSFTCVNSWSEPDNDKYVHADIHDIRIYNNEVWVACDGGIFLSEDSGLTSFNRRQLGIAGTDFWGFGAGFKDGNIMLGGTYHNSHLLKNNNVYENGWISYTGSADGFRGFVNPGYNKWVYNDSRKDKVPATRTDPFINYPFEKQPNASYFLGFSCPLVWHPTCFSTVYSGVDGVLWRSNDDGISWTSIKSFGTGDVTDIEIAFDDPNKIYVVYSPVSGARQIQKTIDGGVNWTNISIPSSVLPSNSSSQIDITLDVHHSDNLWAAILTGNTSSNGNKIYKTIDGGSTWNNITTAALDNQTIQSIVFQRGTDGGVYLGTNKTVFYRNNLMPDWELYNNHLPALTSSLAMVPWYKGGKIRNASNRSVWEAPLYEIGAPIAQITVDKQSSGCLRDTFLLSDYSSQYQSGATWSWQITPAPAFNTPLNQEQVQVVFGSVGSYQVSLVVTDSLGSDSITYANYITITNECNADSIPGNALDIASAGQFGACNNPLFLNSNTVTMSAWIKLNGPQADWAGILFFRGGSTTTGINFRDNGGQIGYHWDGDKWGWDAGPIINENEWAHVALVVTPTSATIYLNGVGYTNNDNHNIEAFDSPLVLGKDPWGSSRTFNGLIDEVCIYNRALSQNEIRELMHLTKKPNIDSTLVTYLQFNESNGIAYDKSGINHISLAGGSSRTTSTAPVGGGVSQRLNINNTGSNSFGNTGLISNFGGVILPNGEVCVTRINLQPDVTPSQPDSTSTTYWIIENYGSNIEFDTLISVEFERTGINLPNCNKNKLYTRKTNADGPVWGEPIDQADVCIGTLPNNKITFETGNSVYQSGQFAIGANMLNPTSSNWFSFSASPYKEGTALLNWTTGKENNTSHFFVERRFSGKGFITIDSIKATGNSGVSTNYQCIDKYPQRGLNEYRIKLVYSTGEIVFSEIKSVLFRAIPQKIMIYPNPQKVGEDITIVSEYNKLKYEMFESNGRLLLSGTIENNVGKISTLNLSKGNYNLIFTVEENKHLYKVILH